MLGNLKNEAERVVLDFEGIQDGGKTLFKLDVNDGSDDGSDVSILNGGGLVADW